MNDPVTITLPREALMHILYRMMSDASEDLTVSGWAKGWEDICPSLAREIVSTGAFVKGYCANITVPQAQTMCAIANALGSWVRPIWNEPRFRLEAYVPPSEMNGET